MDLDQHILRVLSTSGTRQVSISEFARQFGVTSSLVTPAAQRLVDDGQAIATMNVVRGKSTLRAISAPAPDTTATSGPAEA